MRRIVTSREDGADRRSSPASASRWSLVVAILGSAMVFVDGTVLNVALPAIQQGLRGTVAQMQWIVEAYALLLASLVLVGGALGDRLGRKRVFSTGAVLFALASVACALAPDATLLALARGVQGVGGALLVPGSLALVSAAYPEKTRGAAIGIWSAASGVTTSAGPLLGGWIVAHASWRWVFLLNVPLGAAVVVLSGRHVVETRDDTASAHVDWLGATLAATGLGAIVFALLAAPDAGGLGAPRTLTRLALGVVILGGFVVCEARGEFPMVPLALFRSRTFTGTNLLTLLLYAALGGAFFFLPFNLIQVQGYSPAAAGASLLPLVVLVSAMSPFAGRAVAGLGVRTLLVVGPLVAACGFALLALPQARGPYWTTFFPGMVVLGLGMGTTVAPLTTAVMGSVESRHAGLASGINNAVARAAGLLAVAGLGVFLRGRFDRVLDAELDATAAPSSVRAIVDAQRGQLAGADLAGVEPAARAALRRTFDDAYVAGFRATMFACAGLAAAGALLALALMAPPQHRRSS
jgi:EmrB/QacA subfamily drug resistance transporter